MSPSDLLRHYETKAAVAGAIGVDRQVVQGWFDRGRIPLRQQIKYEVATAGALRADVGQDFRNVVAMSAPSTSIPEPALSSAEPAGEEAV